MTPTPSNEIGLTDDDHEQIRRMARAIRSGNDPRQVDDPGQADEPQPDLWRGPFRVSTSICEYIVDEWAGGDGTPCTELADELNLSPRVVQFHGSGKCDHSAGAVVDPRRCSVARELARDGVSYAEIGRFFETNANVVRHHAVGDCTCGQFHSAPAFDEPRQAPRYEVALDECAEWRRRARAGTTAVKISSTIPATRVSVQRHAYGRCNCEHDEPPVETPPAGVKTTVDDCRAWREHVRETGGSPSALAADLPWSKQTVIYHAYGRCKCDPGVDALEKS